MIGGCGRLVERIRVMIWVQQLSGRELSRQIERNQNAKKQCTKNPHGFSFEVLLKKYRCFDHWDV